MKKYVKLTLCGLAVMMLIAGCSKKEDTTQTTETESTTASEGVTEKGSVTKLGTYKGVEVTKASAEVTDEELEQQIQSILKANPEYVAVTDRAAKLGDIVNIDFVGMKDGVAFEGGTGEDYELTLGSGQFIDGFEEGLVGAEVGSELSLNLTFPDPYDRNPDLAGQPVVFDVTVNGIEETKEAVLDDNLVQRMSDFATVDEFRADTLEDMETAKERQVQLQLEADAMQAVIDSSEFDINPDAIEEQYQEQLSYYTGMVEMYGMTMADYVSRYGMTEEDFQNELRTYAEEVLKQQLLIDAIAEAEKLQVEDADRERLAAEYKVDLKTLQDTYGEEAVEESAMIYKVSNLIRDNAVVK